VVYRVGFGMEEVIVLVVREARWLRGSGTRGY
jgi:hypothetical protein